MARVARANTHATEDGWLALQRGGMKVRDIAREAGLSLRRVFYGLAAARDREAQNVQASPIIIPPLLIPSYGQSCKPLAELRCHDVHHGPMPKGSRKCCGFCHKSGVDSHPALYRDPAKDPKPEPRIKPKPDPLRDKIQALTRKQRRAMKRMQAQP